VFVDPTLLLHGNCPKEEFWAVLAHEDVHIKNYLSGRTKVRQISVCRRDNIGKRCAFEFFLDEHQGIMKHMELLISINSLHLAPPVIRENCNPRDLKRSDLTIFRKAYIDSGAVNPFYAQYYDEFERLMLTDESLVYAVLQN